MDVLQQPPPLRDLFGPPAARAAAGRYWVHDTLQGLLNLSIYSAMRLLPSDACSAFGAANAGLSRRRFPDSDARARRLWAALRTNDAAKVDAAMDVLWRNVSRTMAEYSRLHRFWDEGRIVVEGMEHADAARAAGRPTIFAGLHLGNWEILGPALVFGGHPGRATYMPPDNRFDHAIAQKVRHSYGGKLIFPSRRSGREAYRTLTQDKECVLIYIDELSRAGRVAAPAFGRSIAMDGNIANAVRLARLTDAEIFPLYCVRTEDAASFRVTVAPPVKQIRTADSRADLVANVREVDRVITPIVRQHLDQWYYALDFEFDPPA